MKILVIDNYDSFTYNLVHLVKEISGTAPHVFRNDTITVDAVAGYEKIIISPGPGVPDEAGITKELIRQYAASKSILGVCLGCQAIGEVFGGSLVNLSRVYHGIRSEITITDPEETIFRGLPSTFEAGRYHSWAVNETGLPSCLSVTARDSEGMIMALSHKIHDIKGVQFHPESIMTPDGRKIISNWLENKA